MPEQPVMGLVLHPSHVGVIMRALVIAEKTLKEQHTRQVNAGQMRASEMAMDLADFWKALAAVSDHAVEAVAANPAWARWLPHADQAESDDAGGQR